MPYALHLMCDIQMKDNISSKLAELGIPADISEEFRIDIFGKNVGINRHPGLIDCSTPGEFDHRNATVIDGRVEDASSPGRTFLGLFLEI